MCKILYLEDSYLKEFKAKVLNVNSEENYITLDQTAFYPGGGGQPCDFGYIYLTDIRSKVTKVKKIDGRICHFLEGKLPGIDEIITGKIDWNRRYQLMRTHTVLHMLSAVVWHDHHVQVTGGNMEPLSGRLDFEFEQLNSEITTMIEKRVNEEILMEREIVSRTISREEANNIPDLIRTKINLLPAGLKEIRIVEIVGLDLQADGGTHVKNTLEIGDFKIVKYKSKGRTNKRIQIALI